VSTKMIRCPTRRHAKPDDLTNWQVELRTGGQHTPAMIAVLLRESGSRRSLLSPSMQAGIRRLTTSLNNAGRYKFKVRRRTPSDKVISSSCTESHPRPQWITLSSVEVWLQTCCLVSILSTTAEIFLFTRNARCYWACGGARAFTTLSGKVDNTH
jgi:hypothetical protein